MVEFLDTVEGEDAILAAAMAKIEKTYAAKNFDNSPRHFGNPNRGIAVEPENPLVIKQADVEQTTLTDPTKRPPQK